MKTPRGRGEAVLYLDYDGVLHPEDVWWHPARGPYIRTPSGHTLFENAELLEDVLLPYPEVRLVLSTTWVRRYGLHQTAKHLRPSLRERVIGATFHSRMDRDVFIACPRGVQVWQDVLRRKPRAWIAVDDDHLDWPAWCSDKLVASHEVLGIREPGVLQALKGKLRTLGAFS